MKKITLSTVPYASDVQARRRETTKSRSRATGWLDADCYL